MSLRYARFRSLQLSFFPSFDGLVAFLDVTCLPFFLSHLILQADNASDVSMDLVKEDCRVIPLIDRAGNDPLVDDVPIEMGPLQVLSYGERAGVVVDATRIRASMTNGNGGRGAGNSRSGRERDSRRKNSRVRDNGLSNEGGGVLIIHQSWGILQRKRTRLRRRRLPSGSG